MEVEEFVRAKIVIEYCGRNEYRVAAIVDGRVEEVFAAYDYNVQKIRDKAYTRWISAADEIEATEIPPATDMRRSKRF